MSDLLMVVRKVDEVIESVSYRKKLLAADFADGGVGLPRDLILTEINRHFWAQSAPNFLIQNGREWFCQRVLQP